MVHESRKPVMDIADELSLPRATVRERLKKMMEAGVIRRFVAVPDYTKIGRPVMAYVRASFSSEDGLTQRNLAAEISKIPSVYEVSVISGGWDILLKVRVGSLAEIGRLVGDKLRATGGVDKTETCVAFETIKESF